MNNNTSSLSQPKILSEREHSFMLNSLLNELPGGVGIFTFADRLYCQYFNDSFAQLSKRTRAEINELIDSGVFMEKVVAPMDMEKVLAEINNCIKSQSTININFRYIQKDGCVHWIHLSASQIRKENGYPVYYCVFTAPSDETKLFRNIVEDSLNGIIVAERASRRILYLNDTAVEVCGFCGKSSLVGNSILDAFSNAQIKPLLTQDEVNSLSHESFSDFHVLRNSKYLVVRAKALIWNGVDSYIMYISDETEEHNRQNELQQLINRVPTGIGIYTVKNGKLTLDYLNNAFYEMIGMCREKHIHNIGTDAMEAIHPDDRQELYEAVGRLSSGQTEKESSMCRIIGREGTWIWMKLNATAIERAENYLKFFAAFADCDDLVKIQQEQQRDRAKLQAAMENAKVLEWRYDFVRKIVTDSGTMGERYHWPNVIENIPEVVKMLEKKERIHQSSVKDFYWLYEHCADGVRIQRDLRYRSADDTGYVWLHIVYSPIINPDGKITQVIGTAVDITEQKEREQLYEEQLKLKKLSAKDAVATVIFNLTKNTIVDLDCTVDKVKRIQNCHDINEMLADIRDNTSCKEEFNRFKPVQDVNNMLKTFENGVSHLQILHHLKDDLRWMQSTFDMLTNPHTGDVEAIVVLRDVSDAVYAEMIVKKLMSIDYEYIFTADAHTGNIKPHFNKIKNNDKTELLIARGNGPDQYVISKSYLRKHMKPEETENFIRQTDYKYIKLQLKKSPVFEVLYTFESKGATHHRRLLCVYLDEGHNTILGAVQDVSETYEQEQKQQSELKLALEKAEIANKSKTEFLARMSHDMRTPMNGILGLTELSEDENDVQALKSNIVQIRESGNYLLSLINDTLDFQRIESGKLELKRKIVYAKTVFDSMIAVLKRSAADKNIDLQVINHNAELNWFVKADPVRIQQIFINLISNAIKFTPVGGKVIFEIETLSRDGMISKNQYKISDSGIGISREFIENRLYKPFEQEQSDVSTQYAGSGLGLSIVHSLVELMGGQIDVESEIGKGTTFTVTLDFERVNEADAKSEINEKAVSESDSKEKLAGKKILLVEDHPLNAKIARKTLEKVGCDVVWANNGKIGAEVFASSEPGEFDVVLMDIRMPVMNGIDATKAIRNLNRADALRVPIIAMTANAFESDVKICMEAGMNAHLAKPADPEKLYQMISELIIKQTEEYYEKED